MYPVKDYIERFLEESLCFTENEQGTMYYVQIINPSDTELHDMGYTQSCDLSLCPT